jgi:hypothetical protein
MPAKRRPRGSGVHPQARSGPVPALPAPRTARQVEEHFSRLKGESMKAYRARAEAELEKVTLGLAAGTDRPLQVEPSKSLRRASWLLYVARSRRAPTRPMSLGFGTISSLLLGARRLRI